MHTHPEGEHMTAQEFRDHLVVKHLDSPIRLREMPLDALTQEHVRKHLSEESKAWDHPAHYGGADNPYEAIKVIMAWGLGFNLGNTVKYISRAGKKDPAKTIEDLKKARWYLDYEIARLDEASAAAAHDIGG